MATDLPTSKKRKKNRRLWEITMLLVSWKTEPWPQPVPDCSFTLLLSYVGPATLKHVPGSKGGSLAYIKTIRALLLDTSVPGVATSFFSLWTLPRPLPPPRLIPVTARSFWRGGRLFHGEHWVIQSSLTAEYSLCLSFVSLCLVARRFGQITRSRDSGNHKLVDWYPQQAFWWKRQGPGALAVEMWSQGISAGMWRRGRK